MYFSGLTIAMKKLAFVLSFLLLACSSQKSGNAAITGTHIIESDCPPEGNCSFEVLKDKSLLIKTDSFNRTYYEFQDAPGKMVLVYAYNKIKNPAYQDDFYSEEIVFETNNNLSNLKDGGEHDLFFSVKCFCRGKAGTYRLVAGTASIKNNRLHIKLPENIIDNQLIKDVVVSFK